MPKAPNAPTTKRANAKRSHRDVDDPVAVNSPPPGVSGSCGLGPSAGIAARSSFGAGVDERTRTRAELWGEKRAMQKTFEEVYFSEFCGWMSLFFPIFCPFFYIQFFIRLLKKSLVFALGILCIRNVHQCSVAGGGHGASARTYTHALVIYLSASVLARVIRQSQHRATHEKRTGALGKVARKHPPPPEPLLVHFNCSRAFSYDDDAPTERRARRRIACLVHRTERVLSPVGTSKGQRLTRRHSRTTAVHASEDREAAVAHHTPTAEATCNTCARQVHQLPGSSIRLPRIRRRKHLHRLPRALIAAADDAPVRQARSYRITGVEAGRGLRSTHPSSQVNLVHRRHITEEKHLAQLTLGLVDGERNAV